MSAFSSTIRAGSVDISPTSPTVLGANGLPRLKIANVEDPLEANILILGRDPNPLILISCDLLYIGYPLRQLIDTGLADITPPAKILVAASHTHRATMTDPTKTGLGDADSEQIRVIATKICTEVKKIHLTKAAAVSAEIGFGRHNAGINRRKKRLVRLSRSGFSFNTVSIGPNPAGPVDPVVRRVRFKDAIGNPVAEIWSTALHPTGYPRRETISADFPGQVRVAIRGQNKSDTPVLFLQGFGGNIRPNTPVNRSGLRKFLVGSKFAGFTTNSYFTWVRELVKNVLSAEFSGLTGEGIDTVRLLISQNLLVEGAQGPPSAWIHAVRIGVLGIIAVPSEVVVEYSSSLSALEGDRSGLMHLWGIGCVDHVWGYTPTRRMLVEGGYEAEGFCEPFGVERVSPNVEEDLRLALEKTVLALVTDNRI